MKSTSNSKIDEELIHQNVSTTTTSSSSTNKFLFQRPPLDESFISPLKQQWKGFLSSPSNVNKNGLKTPSPARMMRQAVICKNIGNLLLMTPEKDSDEEEEDEEFDEGINEEEIEDDEEEEELKEEENNTKTTSIKALLQ